MAKLEPAFDYAMRFEGGGVVHEVPGDPGGLTKWGLSQRANPDLDIANLSREDAIEAYRERYWTPRKLWGLFSQSMANEVFEFTINADPAWMNRGRAIRAAQKTANDVIEAARLDRDPLRLDGVIGPRTIRALNAIADAGPLHEFAWLDRFNLYQLEFYRSLRRDLVDRFLLGWTRRVVPDGT